MHIMDAPIPALNTRAGQIPSEIINLIFDFAVASDPLGKQILIRNLRHVSRPWADHFYLHGLFDTVFLRSNHAANSFIDGCSTHALLCPRDSSLPTPLPGIRQLRLDGIWDAESFPGAREDGHESENHYLGMSTVTRLLQLLSDHLEQLDLSFVDCLIFSQAAIEAVGNCTRLAELRLSVAWGYDALKEEDDRPDYLYFQHPTLYEFLAAAPSLKRLRISQWEVMGANAWSDARPLCHIEDLSIYAHPHLASLSNLGDVCYNMNSPVKILHIDVLEKQLNFVAAVARTFAETLEALSFEMDGAPEMDYGDCEEHIVNVFQDEFPKLKVLFLTWDLFSQFELELVFARCVETLAVDGFDDEEFETVWESARTALPNLKRLFFITSSDMQSSIDEVVGNGGPVCATLSTCDLAKLIKIQETESNLDQA